QDTHRTLTEKGRRVLRTAPVHQHHLLDSPADIGSHAPQQLSPAVPPVYTHYDPHGDGHLPVIPAHVLTVGAARAAHNSWPASVQTHYRDWVKQKESLKVHRCPISIEPT